MLNQIGLLFLILSFLFSIYSFITAFFAVQKKKTIFLRSSVNAVGMAFISSSFAFFILMYQFYASDFSNAFVAANSNYALPLFYKVTAIWAGQEGSLLLWIWILFLLAYIATKVYYKKEHGMWQRFSGKTKSISPDKDRYHPLLPYVLVIIMANGIFFTFTSLISSNPFSVLNWQDTNGILSEFIPRDGNGLNPLLQHPAMVIHPPLLYVGFVGFVIPFAFAIAALWSRNLGEGWIKTIRKWTITVWLFLTAGIILGGHWAYVELGWGGYWAWDPVENGSLLPWLTGTAFLHSVIIQEKRGMLKVWNVTLIVLTYILVIIATLITRSGLISSVHSFAKSNVGALFSTFLLGLIVLSVYLIVTRLPLLKSEYQLDSLVSRESSFLYNNLILLTMTFAILWGTIFPLVSEVFTRNKITVGPGFFNSVNMPLGLLLLFLTGLGPMLAWRKTTMRSLLKNLLWPSLAFFVTLAVMIANQVNNFFAIMSMALSVFVFIGAAQEFLRGLRARLKHHKEFFLLAFLNMMRQNQRRYGGYIVHVGIVLLFIGFAGNAFNLNQKLAFGIGESHIVGDYRIQVVDFENGRLPNYHFSKAKVAIFLDGKKLTELEPEKRVYTASQQSTTEVAIYYTVLEDVYIVFDGMSQGQANKIELHIWIKPLVSLIWIGGFVMLFGIIVALLPGLRAARKENSDLVSVSNDSIFLYDLQEKKNSLLRNVKDLDLDWDMGKFAEEDYQRMRVEYMENLSLVLGRLDEEVKLRDSVIQTEADAEAYIQSEINKILESFRRDNGQDVMSSTVAVADKAEESFTETKTINFCAQCGKRVSGEDKFCSNCGNRL